MNIIVYTIPTCPWCDKLKTFLKKKKILFEERDVKEEAQWREELLIKTSQIAVPVTEIDDELIVGFDEKVIEAAIQKAKEK